MELAQHSAVVVCSRGFWKEQVTVLNAVDLIGPTMSYTGTLKRLLLVLHGGGGGGELKKNSINGNLRVLRYSPNANPRNKASLRGY